MDNIKQLIRILTGLKPDRILWFWLLLVSIMSLYDIIVSYSSHSYTASSFALSLVGETCFAVLKATVIVYLYALSRYKRWLHVIMILVIIIFSVLSTVNFFSYLIYNRGISRAFFLILFETDSVETSGFIKGLRLNLTALLHDKSLLIGVVGLSAVYAMFRFLPFLWLKRCCMVMSVIGAVFFVFVVFMAPIGKSSHFMFVRTPQFALSGYHEHMSTIDTERYRKPFPFPETVESQYLAQDVIVVIGESSARMHNSLYGYNHPTNYYTEQLRDSLFIFTDAISSACSTMDNMPRILTFMPDSILGKWYDYPSVVDLFKTGGYRTYWLSNQERVGNMSNTSTCIAATADVIDYVGTLHSEDFGASNYDASLIAPLRKALNDSAAYRLCFLHLIGSHIFYKDRFPPQFAKFTAEDELKKSPGKWLNREKAQIRADYDNSVRYTDSLLVEMIKMISSSPRPSILMYFSDHGEHIYDNRDHLGRTDSTVTVPCWDLCQQFMARTQSTNH